MQTISIFTARRSYASAVFWIIIMSVCPSVHLSVRVSVTRVLCDETKEHTADILISHERVITILTPTEIGGRCSLPPEICA